MSSELVNSHINRVINDGGDVTTVNVSFLNAFDAMLANGGWHKNLMIAADPSFGVKRSGGFISKTYCFGTTRMPKYGDLTHTTSDTFPSTSSNTTYSATGMNSVSPAWVNGASNARGYFGNGRSNIVQRKRQSTVVAVYQKPSTGKLSLFGMGENAGMFFNHGSGSPGVISFAIADSPEGPGNFTTATVPSSGASAAHVIGGVFDEVNITTYSDGVAGTPASATSLANPLMANQNALRGHYNGTAGTSPFLGHGGDSNRATRGFPLTFTQNEAAALGSVSLLAMFDVGNAAIYTAIRSLYVGWPRL